MEIYVDMVILENTIVNLFLLLLTVKLLRFSYKPFGLYFAAILGGIYTLVIFTDIKVLTALYFKVLVAILMVVITLNKKSIENILKSTVVFFLVSFMLSGLCFGVAMMQNSYTFGQAFIIENYSIKWLLLSIMILYIVVNRIFDYLRERATIKNFIYDIYITVGKKTLLLKGFLDTGNELREPATNLPCIIIEEKYLKEIDIPIEQRFKINYKTISDNGNLLGFKGDEVRIKNEGNNEWTNVEAIICGCQNKLSKEDDFQALLSRGIV